ncbi:reticulon-4b isoform X1 [Colossoma macropomum]|uniref:reticulon-4b isoform X1 n=1 Tax=Colossoma macropomum TaxID=42526 RepID=UPI001863DDBB|nr:reticulon-4b isoform X1 [Colossoma macropomum]
MADTEEVSSTTPNEVQEESAMGDLKGSTNEAAARRDNVGFAGGEQDETEVSEVKKGVETQAEDELPSPGEAEAVAVAAAAEAVLASALEPEPEPLVTSTVEEPLKKEEQEEEEVVVAQTADKAETELPEKTDLISHSEPSEVKESVQTEEQQVAVEVAAAAPVQEVTAPEAEEAPKPPPADEKEAIPKQPEQEEAVTAVPEPVAEPAAAVTSTVEPEEVTESPVEETELIQKQEDFNITAAAPAPVVKAEETFKSAPVEEEPTPAAPAPPSSHEPSLPAPAAAPAAPFPPLMQFTSENGNSSLIASQDVTKITMDSFGNDSPSRNTPRYEPDVLNQSDDDLMFDMKKNPFQDFSPVDNLSSEFSHFGETTADTRAAQMSDSPSPDLVQNAHDGELQDDVQDYEPSFDSREAATESLRQQLASSDIFTTSSKEHEESALPPSLPDILKSSPLNPDKVDSGSSEGSPDFSPVHRSGNDSPNAPFSLSANNPFAFETKVPLLKEMTEETEARAAAEKAKLESEKASEQIFGAFDLVKEAEISPKGNDITVEDQDDFKSSSQDSVQMVDKFECLSFPTGRSQEHFDSESPSADSLSPVLEAMAKNPASFQIEPEKNLAKEEVEEAADEVSEQEVSSEEFEFVEKPPRGAIDEFLETLDNSKFAKASEMAEDDEDVVPELAEQVVEKTADASSAAQETKSSYLLLTEPLDGASPARGKAGLELSDFQVPSKAPLAHSPVVKTETTAMKKVEPKVIKLPSLSAGAVVDLLYWRDVKNTGVVFGASLLLLLSLSMCSIISVLSYVALALLSVTITFRIYKGILQAIQKSDEGHPFKQYLDQDVALPEEVVHKYSDIALGRINATIIELRRLFLVEDLVDSLKFAVFMWILTYVGALFNGLTLLILGLISAFSCPMLYEKHQTQIDHYIGLVNSQIKDVVGKIQAKMPGAKKKAE